MATQSGYRGNAEECPTCKLTYGNFKTGFKYFDIWMMYWNPPDTPPEEWVYKRRGTILGKWFELKQLYWEQHKEECRGQAEYEAREAVEYISDDDYVPF